MEDNTAHLYDSLKFFSSEEAAIQISLQRIVQGYPVGEDALTKLMEVNICITLALLLAFDTLKWTRGRALGDKDLDLFHDAAENQKKIIEIVHSAPTDAHEALENVEKIMGLKIRQEKLLDVFELSLNDLIANLDNESWVDYRRAVEYTARAIAGR